MEKHQASVIRARRHGPGVLENVVLKEDKHLFTRSYPK